MFGVDKGLRHARKHLSAYAEHAGGDAARQAELRDRLVTTADPHEAVRLLNAVFDGGDDVAAFGAAA